MSQQMVEVAVINKVLGLALDTSVEAALSHINELLIFRQNHQYCKSIIANLQEEVIKIKIHVESQVANYIKHKINLAQTSIEAITQAKNREELAVQKSLKAIKIPETLEEFMQNEFECQLASIKKITTKFKLISNFNLCIKPFITPSFNQSLSNSTQEVKNRAKCESD